MTYKGSYSVGGNYSPPIDTFDVPTTIDPHMMENAVSDVDPRREVLEEALGIVTGSRAEMYGGPEDNFRRICDQWNPYIREAIAIQGELKPHDVAWLMVLMKAARSLVSPNGKDHYVDAAGYSACGYKARPELLEKGSPEASDWPTADQKRSTLVQYYIDDITPGTYFRVWGSGDGWLLLIAHLNPSAEGPRVEAQSYLGGEDDTWTFTPGARFEVLET